MQERLEARQHCLEEVFREGNLFEIPDYQRPYAWTTEETNELLDDLLQAMGETGPVDNIPPYFLGSIVLIKPDGQAPAEVVDGQQRLTTLTLLFCVLRELADTTDDREVLDRYIRERGNRFAGTPSSDAQGTVDVECQNAPEEQDGDARQAVTVPRPGLCVRLQLWPLAGRFGSVTRIMHIMATTNCSESPSLPPLFGCW